MKHSRRLIVFASFLILTFLLVDGSMTKEGNKEEN